MTVAITPTGPVISIKTSQALRGFLYAQPVQTPEGDHVRADAVIGQTRYGRTQDGQTVRLEPDTCHLVAHGAAAVNALARLRVGDEFIAAGYMGLEDVLNVDTGQTDQRPVFTTDRIGVDMSSLTFEQMLARHVPIRPAAPRRATAPTGPRMPAGFTTMPGGKLAPETPGL